MATDSMQPGATRPVASLTWRGFGRGAKLALPVVLGYAPVGFAFGVLAAGAGMTGLDVGLMSLFVYAGSAQLIAVDLVQAGLAGMSIVLTTFIVNLRHLLMSAALAPSLRGSSTAWLAAFSFEMTDEAFAVHAGRFAAGHLDRGEMLGINVASHASWLIASLCGALLGDSIADVKPYGLDYALSGMFIALVLPHCRIPRRLAAAALAAFVAVLLTLYGAADWSAILATVVSATLVALVSVKKERRTREAQHVE